MWFAIIVIVLFLAFFGPTVAWFIRMGPLYNRNNFLDAIDMQDQTQCKEQIGGVYEQKEIARLVKSFDRFYMYVRALDKDPQVRVYTTKYPEFRQYDFWLNTKQ